VTTIKESGGLQRGPSYINEGGQEEGLVPTQHRKSDPSNNARRKLPTPECEPSNARRFTWKRAVGAETKSVKTGRYPVRRKQSAPINDLEGDASGEDPPLGPPKGRSSMLPHLEGCRAGWAAVDRALKPEQWNAARHERANRSSEGASRRTEGTTPIGPIHSESHRQFLRYQETPPLEPVTQDMLNSQMHRLITPRLMDTPSNR